MEALRAQNCASGPHEIVLVDDGSRPPIDQAVAAGARLLRTSGLGLASARNVGLAAASGELVCFTDDDCLPVPGWVDAAVEYLRAHPDHSGVQGPVNSEPWDPLYGHSLAYDGPGEGRYYGANIAYRRELLEREGGFAQEFDPYHGEDLDMAFRMLAHGPIGWAPEMAVVHKPKALTFAQIVRRGRFAPHEVLVHRRHADHFGGAARLPHFLFPFANILVVWSGELRAEWPGILLKPTRLARLLGLAAGQVWETTRSLLGR